jgi:hypothetical protein
MIRSLRTTLVAVFLKKAQPSRDDAVGGGGECSPFHHDAVIFLLSAAHLDQMGDSNEPYN